jgi:hypothetical protein
MSTATPGPWTCAGPSYGEPLPRYFTEVCADWGPEDDGDAPTLFEIPEPWRDEESNANALVVVELRNAAAELIRDARLWREHCYIESQSSRSPNP